MWLQGSWESSRGVKVTKKKRIIIGWWHSLKQVNFCRYLVTSPVPKFYYRISPSFMTSRVIHTSILRNKSLSTLPSTVTVAIRESSLFELQVIESWEDSRKGWTMHFRAGDLIIVIIIHCSHSRPQIESYIEILRFTGKCRITVLLPPDVMQQNYRLSPDDQFASGGKKDVTIYWWLWCS